MSLKVSPSTSGLYQCMYIFNSSPLMGASFLKCNYSLSLVELITIVYGNITNAQLAMGSLPRYSHHLIEPNTCMINVDTCDYLSPINDGQTIKGLFNRTISNVIFHSNLFILGLFVTMRLSHPHSMCYLFREGHINFDRGDVILDRKYSNISSM